MTQLEIIMRYATLITLLLLMEGLGQETTETPTTTESTTTMSSDENCKHPTYVRRRVAGDVRAASPFYVVAITKTPKTKQIDNVCYTYFEDNNQFLHIISIVHKDGSRSQVVLHKHDIDGEPGVAVGTGEDCTYHDYTLPPVCNETVFPLYRCVVSGSCSQLDIGPVAGVDSRVVLAADPSISKNCASEIKATLRDTSELDGDQFLILPRALKPQCVTTYTLHSINADRALGNATHTKCHSQ